MREELPEEGDRALVRTQGSSWPFPAWKQGSFSKGMHSRPASPAQPPGGMKQSQKSRRKMLSQIVHLLLIGRLRA